MTKQELIELIESLHPEDTKGELTGIFIGRHGRITTDSIRIDMDGGRVILAQKEAVKLKLIKIIGKKN